MLIIQGCKGASIDSLKCDNQIKMPVFVEGSGHRYLTFCSSCSDCPLKMSFRLEEFKNTPQQKESE